VPLYVLGGRMRSLYAYVPIAAGLRVSIGIFSYLGAITFGINADFDAFPDVDVLAHGIHAGMAELLELAESTTDGRRPDEADRRDETSPRKAAARRRTPAKQAGERASTSRS
jgi:hypothetical protein